MTFLEKIQVIERVDGLIRRKSTGTAEELGAKLGISRRSVFDILSLMRSMDAPIDYCAYRKSYYYLYPCNLRIGFVEQEKIYGGNATNFPHFLTSAVFLPSHPINWSQNHDSGTFSKPLESGDHQFK